MSEIAPSRSRRLKTGGRQKGTPNYVTAVVRQNLTQLAEGNTDRVQGWLDAVAAKDPAEAIRLWLHLLEFVTPKLRATAVSVEDNSSRPIQRMAIAELQAIVNAT